VYQWPAFSSKTTSRVPSFSIPLIPHSKGFSGSLAVMYSSGYVSSKNVWFSNDKPPCLVKQMTSLHLHLVLPFGEDILLFFPLLLDHHLVPQRKGTEDNNKIRFHYFWFWQRNLSNCYLLRMNWVKCIHIHRYSNTSNIFLNRLDNHVASLHSVSASLFSRICMINALHRANRVEFFFAHAIQISNPTIHMCAKLRFTNKFIYCFSSVKKSQSIRHLIDKLQIFRSFPLKLCEKI
jgi:hypothetical protein